MSLQETIRKHALKNAFDYGKAQPGSVVSKVIAEFPEAKKDMKATMQEISRAVAEINALPKQAIEKELSNYHFEEKVEKEKELTVPNAEQGKVVTRYPPEPNGWPHIGHAKAFTLSWKIARKYGGKVILRWDDTNPEAEKPEFLEGIREGIKWLGLDWDEEKYCSDYLPQMYELCEKLLKSGDAYACSCSQEKVAAGREKKKRCECGNASPEENKAKWQAMLADAGQGTLIIRLKADMASQNTVMRDPTLFRIIANTPHHRQGSKYRVWPTYDFQGAVMDSLLGITHPIRSKEYELRDELYVYLLEKLGLRVPQMITISRLALKNAPISKRLLRPLVESGNLWGWDDPRLPTLAGLRRRGILPEAIQKFVLSFGISKVESEPAIDALLVENRKLLEPIAPHYFFVSQPVRLTVKNAPSRQLELHCHPTNPALGKRQITTQDNFFISGGATDAESLQEGETIRLKEAYNVKITRKTASGLEGEYAGEEIREGKKLQWIAAQEAVAATLVEIGELMQGESFNPNSLKETKGYCEKACLQLKQGAPLQFERVGFAVLDDKKQMRFIKSC